MKKSFLLIESLLVFFLLVNVTLAQPSIRRNRTTDEPLPYDPEAQERAIEEVETTTTTTQPEGLLPEFKLPELDSDTIILLEIIGVVAFVFIVIALIKRAGREPVEFKFDSRF